MEALDARQFAFFQAFLDAHPSAIGLFIHNHGDAKELVRCIGRTASWEVFERAQAAMPGGVWMRYCQGLVDRDDIYVRDSLIRGAIEGNNLPLLKLLAGLASFSSHSVHDFSHYGQSDGKIIC